MAEQPDDVALQQRINETFQYFDRAKNGTCDEQDVVTIIQALGLNPDRETADQLLDQMRGDDPGTLIRRDMFALVMTRVLQSQNSENSLVPEDSEQTILRAFQALDQDKRGYLEIEELKKSMTIDAAELGLAPFTEEEWESMKNACEDPESGYVFYEDFAEILAGKKQYSLD